MSADTTLSGLTAALFLGSARGFGFAAVFPIFTLFQVTGLLAFGTAAALSLPVILSVQNDFAAAGMPAPLLYLGLLVKEIGVGAALGALLGAPFWAVLHGGALVDHYRGATTPALYDPTAAVDTTSLASLLSSIAALIYVSQGGIAETVDILWSSFRVWPVLEPWPTAGTGGPATIGHLMDAIFSRGLLFVAAFMILLVAIDLALVFLNRSTSQLPIFELGSTAKNLAAVLLAVAVAWVLPNYVQAVWEPFLASARQILGLP
ncbi:MULTISPECIES: EscT/YscT/HrcT family type III secretion system export apparatus protein [unclassified Aureimonas]|uniref:EscT/YscT/HrcT family type III secretion system export apparatus protein n=1 Tax=unclassified Aureimonas TaxID=2615206 RepID=UPI000AD19F80|nr:MULTISPECIES: flagellar biosynthetic protein FliR [unclassified Aureimonas]